MVLLAQKGDSFAASQQNIISIGIRIQKTDEGVRLQTARIKISNCFPSIIEEPHNLHGFCSGSYGLGINPSALAPWTTMHIGKSGQSCR